MKVAQLVAKSMHKQSLPCFCNLSCLISSSLHSNTARGSSRARLSGEEGEKEGKEEACYRVNTVSGKSRSG